MCENIKKIFAKCLVHILIACESIQFQVKTFFGSWTAIDPRSSMPSEGVVINRRTLFFKNKIIRKYWNFQRKIIFEKRKEKFLKKIQNENSTLPFTPFGKFRFWKLNASVLIFFLIYRGLEGRMFWKIIFTKIK